MEWKGRIGLLSSLRRSKPHGRVAKGCSECEQTGPGGTERPVSNEAKKSPAVSPPNACNQEQTEATGGKKRSLSAPGTEGKNRVCIICSKPSDEMICGACSDKVSADALEKKRWEETGKP